MRHVPQNKNTVCSDAKQAEVLVVQRIPSACPTNKEDIVKTAVVILNWNGSALLKRFLPALIAHTQMPDTELIVADNGSSDDSKAVIAQFPELRLLDLKENHGFAKGYNLALSQVDAEYFVLLNSDVEVTEGWLTALVDFMDANPTYAACQPKILDQKNKQRFEYAGAAGGELDALGYPFCRGRLLDRVEDDKGQYDGGDTEIFWASGACQFVRAKLFTKYGGLDEDFWAHMEEIDLCWRVQNAGYKIGIVPQSRVFHVGGGSLSYGSPRKLFLNFRNNLFMLYKNLPSNLLFRVIFMRMLLDGLAAVLLFAKGEGHALGTVLKAHLAFYRALPVLRTKRKTHVLNRQLGYANCYTGLLLWQYYAKKIRTFSELIQYNKK